MYTIISVFEGCQGNGSPCTLRQGLVHYRQNIGLDVRDSPDAKPYVYTVDVKPTGSMSIRGAIGRGDVSCSYYPSILD